jgi:lipopolysaccharide exporter
MTTTNEKGNLFFSKTVNGLKWSYIFTGVNVVTQLALTTILARLLSPDDYGLIAMGNVVLRFGSYFAQMGIGQALIQNQSNEKKEIFTAYAISLIISSFLYIVIYFLAPFSELVFSNHDVVEIIRVLAINFIFSSISMVSISILRMKFKFLLLGSIDFISYLFGNAVISIVFASLGFGVWSLIWASLLQSFILFVLSLYFTKNDIQFQKVSYKSAKALLSYGSKYTISTFLEVVTYSADAVICGHYFSTRILGIYNRATLLVQLPAQHISANLIKVFFPTLNAIKNDRIRFAKYYHSVSLILGVILFGVCIFISINAQEIVTVLLGPKWIETIPILKVFALAIPFHLLINYQGLVYDVYGHLKKKIVIKILHLACMLLMFFVLKSYGLVGIAFAFMLTEMFFYFVYVFIGLRILKEEFITIIKIHIPYAYIAFIVFASAYSINVFYSYMHLPMLAGFLLEMSIVPVVCLFMLLYFPPTIIKTMVADFISIRNINQDTENKPRKTRIINKIIFKIAYN